MRLCRLIYRSVATEEPVSKRLLRELEQQAATANKEREITGLLALVENVFVQVLEGEATALTGLFSRIAVDDRHRDVELVTFQPIRERLFEDWSMRAVDLYDLSGENRAMMAAKYQARDGYICVPDSEILVTAFLRDARFVCSSSPWWVAGTVENSEPGV